MSVKLSVIIPIYNVEKYLNQTLETIRRQTFTDFECIMINDGSTDDSEKIINKYCAEDHRFRCIHHTNSQGAGPSRNDGLKEAKGSFIYFMDSDDTIEVDTFADNLVLFEDSTAIVMFGHEDIKNGTVVRTSNLTERKIHASDFSNQFISLMKTGAMYTIWNKIYRKSFLDENDLWFGDEKRGQDYLFNLRVYQNTPEIIINSDIYYHYVVLRPGANTTKAHPDFISQVEREYRELGRTMDTIDVEEIATREFLESELWKYLFTTFSTVRKNKSVRNSPKLLTECYQFVRREKEELKISMKPRNLKDLVLLGIAKSGMY